jgi:hypothetical protein
MRKIANRQPDGPCGAIQEFSAGYRIDQRLVCRIGAKQGALACIRGVEVKAQGVVGYEGDEFLILDVK